MLAQAESAPRRAAGMYTSQVASASPAAAMRGSTRLVFNNSAPVSAPPNIASTAAILRTEPFPSPPASGESAASPVSVIVSTVVVRSGTPIRRTVAFRTPIANASSAITMSPEAEFGRTFDRHRNAGRHGEERDLDGKRAGDMFAMAVADPVGEHPASARPE